MVLGAKCANMLRLLKYLDLLVPKENITLSPTTRTVVPAMLCIYFHGNCDQNDTQAD